MLGYLPRTSKHYAIKLFELPEGNLSLTFLNEASFAGLQHKNLLTPQLCAQKRAFKKGSSTTAYSVITMEYAENMTLFEWVSEKGLAFSEKLTRTFFHQLIEGLEYMHAKGCAHLDIKPENIFFDADFNLKIGDFDLSFGNAELFPEGSGTVDYRSPQLAESKYDDMEADDVFSAGIVLFCMLSGGILPFVEQTDGNDFDFYGLLQANPAKFWENHPRISQTRCKGWPTELKALFEGMV